MHARFNLNPDSRNWKKFLSAGNEIHTANKKIVETNLRKFEDACGHLQAEKIIENWFPNINADVFLSHSHKDEDLIIGLAGWLSETFGLKSFIDSTVWGYSDKLLRLIDDKYCLNQSEKSYAYSKRNRSTSHVHMMLSASLMNMMDKCECIIFVNTPHSYEPAEYFEAQGVTESPWIFSEIAMTRILRQKPPEEHRPKRGSGVTTASLERISESKELHVSYPADLLHLTTLTLENLDAWEEKEGGAKNHSMSLDSLYEMKRVSKN